MSHAHRESQNELTRQGADVVEGPYPVCPTCDYNLTGLTGSRCPECGWWVDWAAAWSNEESRRRGTPAYRDSGLRLGGALRTTGLMLIHPIQFARDLRHDEPLWPALFIALLAYACVAVPASLHDGVRGNQVYLPAIAACIGCNLVGFMLATHGRLGRLSAWRRARLFLLVSLYSTCFVTAWLVVGPPCLLDWNDANFVVLSMSPRLLWTTYTYTELLSRTLIFYWWASILVVFAFVRGTSRRRAALFIPMPVLATFLATRVGALFS